MHRLSPIAPRANRTAPITIGVMIFVVLALQLNPAAHAQCRTQNPAASTGHGWFSLLRYFTPAVMGCVVAVNNAQVCAVSVSVHLGCFPPGPTTITGSCVQVRAGVTSYPTMMSSCVFACTAGCASFTIDGPNDGLPVELMEFSVEPEERAGASNSEPVADGKPEGDSEA